MKVGYVGSTLHAHCTEVHLTEALRNNGVDVENFQENDLTAWADLTSRVGQFDFVLWTRTGWQPPIEHAPQFALLAAAKAAGVPVVGYHLDRWWGLDREAQVACEPYFKVDLLVTADGGHEAEWAAAGVAHEWLPPGVLRSETERVGVVRPDMAAQVGFVGSGSRYHREWRHRPDLLRFLATRYRRRFRHWEGGIRGQDLADLYATVPILVGDSCLVGGAKFYASDRIPESLGRGAFLIHPRVEGVTDGTLWQEGEHLVCWDVGDWDELQRLIDHYLAHPDEARAIAAAGKAHTQAFHTYENRVAQMLAVLHERGLVNDPLAVPATVQTFESIHACAMKVTKIEPTTCPDCGGHLRDACRACGRPDAEHPSRGGTGVEPVLCLGRVPLANALLDSPDDPCERFPLHLACCAACGAVQVTDPVDPAAIFTDAYPYRSSVNGPMVESARVLVEKLCAERALGADDLVVEIGSNDGYLLQHYRDRGVRVIGIDPSEGAAAEARERGIDTHCVMFSAKFGQWMGAHPSGRAAVVHANNVLAHIPDVTDALRGVAAMLAPDGVAVVETPYLPDLLAGRAFDTIYAEHVYYWSATAFARAARRAGLTLVGVERFDLHGGSLRMALVRAGCGQPSESVRELLAAEAEAGLADPAILKGFADEVVEVIAELRKVVGELRLDGKTVAAYGAAAKGVMLLNACGFTADDIAWCADSTPGKQGLFMPGSGVPIVDPERLNERPDAVLILAWNFASAIMAKHDGFYGQWIVPLPEPRFVG